MNNSTCTNNIILEYPTCPIQNANHDLTSGQTFFVASIAMAAISALVGFVVVAVEAQDDIMNAIPNNPAHVAVPVVIHAVGNIAPNMENLLAGSMHGG